MKNLLKPLTMIALGAAAVVSFAQVVIPKGTDVDLRFMQRLNSKTATPGESVRLAVANDVYVNGHDVLRAGTPVTGVLTKVTHRDHFGKNGQVRIALNPVRTRGGWVYLEARDKQSITGRRSDTAGAASAGGALVLGPVGLIGGYFVVGKPVRIQVGDPLYTQVSRTVELR